MTYFHILNTTIVYKMKFATILSFCFIIFSTLAFSQNDKAIEYNDKIVDEQSKIIVLMLEVVDMMDKDLDKCEIKRLETVKQIENSILVVEKMSSFEGNTELRGVALDLFKFYKKTFTDDYKVLLDILKKGENITEEDITTITDISNKISEAETKLDDNFAKIQYQFAQKYGFEIEENELQEEIDEM